MHKRREIPYPCATHGNPADVTAVNLAWLDLFYLLQDYSDIRFLKQKDKEKAYSVLNVPVMKILCDELELEFLPAFERLTLINRIFNEV